MHAATLFRFHELVKICHDSNFISRQYLNELLAPKISRQPTRASSYSAIIMASVLSANKVYSAKGFASKTTMMSRIATMRNKPDRLPQISLKIP